MMHAFRFVGLLLVLGSTAFAPCSYASKPSTAREDRWISPPKLFLVSRMVRAAGTPDATYQVVLDVPPTPTGKTPRPKVATSCGDTAVDAIAWDYVKSTLRKKSALTEQNQHKELRFQIRMSPVPLAVDPPAPPSSGDRYQGFYTPKPSYPYANRAGRQQGRCILRVTSAYGRITRVILLESTGNDLLDANAALFALGHWAGPKNVPETTVPIPVIYVLR